MLAESEGFNLVLLVGFAIFFGTLGAGIFQKFRIPKIIGYIVIGVILGPCLKVITPETIELLEPFNVFALGIIGFLIGGELKRDIFVRFGRQVLAILLFEGLTAFALVGGASFLIMMFFADWQTSLSVGVVFGAICAATDPASTMNVLWEYKTRGPLTTMLTAIVALDDALALLLYIVSVSLASVLTGRQEDGGVLWMVIDAFYEIAGSLALGALAGVMLKWIINRVTDYEKILVFTIGSIVLCIGLAANFGMDVILSSMALGVAIINLSPRQSLKSFELVRRFSPPIYVLFFTIIGARLNVTGLNAHILFLAAAYVIGSIIGKTSGAYWGATYSKAVPTVKKYLGFCLYPQGTIAIALLMMAGARFEGEIRDTMLSVIIIGVLVLQLIGPLCVKAGAAKAGEVGMNITEDDLIDTYTVSDVMDTDVPVISSGMSLSEVIQVVSSTDNFYYSVVDNEDKLIGAVTLDGIRNTFTTQEVNDWLVALDIAEPVIARLSPEIGLREAFEKADRLDLEHIPVTASDDKNRFVAIIDCRAVRRSLSAEVLKRQQKADNIHGGV